MAVPQTLLSAEDLLKMPRGDGHRYELRDGELIEMSPAGLLHGKLVMRVGIKVGTFVDANNLGLVVAAETGFILRRNPDRVRAPDCAFIAADRLPPGPTASRYSEVVPDFVVEVISPNDTAAAFQQRVDDWLDAGVKVLWAVYPEVASVFIWRGRNQVERRSAADEIDAEPVLPDFRWKVSDLFRE